MAGQRIARLNGEFRKEISEIIRISLSNREPNLKGLISITEVDTAPDIKTAKVYVSIFAKDEKEKLSSFSVLERNAPFIRHELAERMTIRSVPQLTFLWDGSMSYGAKMDELFKKLHEKEEKGKDHDGEEDK